MEGDAISRVTYGETGAMNASNRLILSASEVHDQHSVHCLLDGVSVSMAAETHLPFLTDELLQNQLLAALSSVERERLIPYLQAVDMSLGKVLYESGDTLRHVYFPADCIVSLLCNGRRVFGGDCGGGKRGSSRNRSVHGG
jgi:hypothetical protein